MPDYYVDSLKADDNGDGNSMLTAKKHISAALALCSDPITATTTIHLAGTLASPQIYEETNDVLYLNDIRCVGDAGLIVRPDDMDMTHYTSGTAPFTGAASWDPRGEKPCVLPRIEAARSNGVSVTGCQISGQESDLGFKVTGRSWAQLQYCRVIGFGSGVAAGEGSYLSVENCQILNSGAGIMIESATVHLVGDIYINDTILAGIVAIDNANVTVEAWNEMPTAHFTLEIRNTTPRKNYAAIVLMVNSCLWVKDMSDLAPGLLSIANVKIISEAAVKSAGFKGVSLESGSKFIGSDNVSFSEPATNDGDDTVPEGQQFVEKDGEGTTVVK